MPTISGRYLPFIHKEMPVVEVGFKPALTGQILRREELTAYLLQNELASYSEGQG